MSNKKRFVIELNSRDADIIYNALSEFQDHVELSISELTEEQHEEHAIGNIDTIEDYQSACDAFQNMKECI